MVIYLSCLLQPTHNTKRIIQQPIQKRETDNEQCISYSFLLYRVSFLLLLFAVTLWMACLLLGLSLCLLYRVAQLSTGQIQIQREKRKKTRDNKYKQETTKPILYLTFSFAFCLFHLSYNLLFLMASSFSMSLSMSFL